jgi:ketosteroid isomerase-like protein
VSYHHDPSPAHEDNVTRDDIRLFAERWVGAWNAHDLEAIMSHYGDEVELVSPVAQELFGVPAGRVIGKDKLREYFSRGLKAFPELRFELKDVLVGVESVVLYYLNQKGTRTAELVGFSAEGKVTRVAAHYSL